MFGIVVSRSKFAAAAKSLQSCPTLCDPIDGSPPGSTAPGILQARTLECVAISFSRSKFRSMLISTSFFFFFDKIQCKTTKIAFADSFRFPEQFGY